MPRWVEKWINGYLAKILGMERPANEPGNINSILNIIKYG